ncbi:unnamed protein product [Peniophora sp. CBMAI 1063]|nr:unnamed protein product [Peniophora sp. CBMAI 1063]
MPFLVLPAELKLSVFELDLEDDACQRAGLLLPHDRLCDYIQRRDDIYRDDDHPLCLTSTSLGERILSRQASACVDDRRGGLPRIFQLCHICASLRSLIRLTPSLWARQAACWPGHYDHVLANAGDYPLSFLSWEGLCACAYRDIEKFLHRAKDIAVALPSEYLRVDGAKLSTAQLLRRHLLQAIHLVDLEMRFDAAHAESRELKSTPVVIPTLRRARVQNSDVIPTSPGLRELHIAVEPGGPTLSLSGLLHLLRIATHLRVVVLQYALEGGYSIPWEVESKATSRVSLNELRHLTCAGYRGLTRVLMYWICAPALQEFHVDIDFDLGVTPLDQIPSQLAAETWILLHPGETVSAMDYARRKALMLTESEESQEHPPDVPDIHTLSCLAIDVIPDSEAEDPLSSWPRLITVAAAPTAQEALRGVSPQRDSTSIASDDVRRLLTMRNAYASFPGDECAALREGHPKQRKPSHLGTALALPLSTYLHQADAADAVTYLAFKESSWVPVDERGWGAVLAELPMLQELAITGRASPESAASLARYLLQHAEGPRLQKVTLQDAEIYLDQTKGPYAALMEAGRTQFAGEPRSSASA